MAAGGARVNNDAMTGSSLISITDLAQELEGDCPPILLDVRWTLAGPRHDEYLVGHLPEAHFVDLDGELAAPPPQPPSAGRHPLPEPERLQQLWRSVGISGDTPVVVYDAGNGSVAARAWWLLRWSGHRSVQLLDGGWAAWTRAGLPIATGDARAEEPGWMTVEPGSMPVADLEAVEAVDASGTVLLDARARERYLGEIEPLDPTAGHIPGAVNLPLTELLTDHGTFLPRAALTARFAAAGLAVDPSAGPAAGTIAGTTSGITAGTTAETAVVSIASCGSGVTACHLILAAEEIGLPLALYPGSFSGWCGAGREVAVG